MENYVLYDELGKGTFSVVYKGRKKGSVEYVAVHCAEKTKRQELQNIVRLTHELSHDNVVTFYEWYETTNHIWMIVELCTGQTLSVMLEQDGCFPETTVRDFGLDIARGLHYLHGLGILYCDLRCSKLILDGYGKIKLSNFSLAKVEGESEPHKLGEDDELKEESRRPSPMYMAPEVLHGHMHTIASDMWSFGCVLYELFTGSLSFEADSFPELINKVMTQNLSYPIQVVDGIELGCSDEFHNLLQCLLCKDEGLRLIWNELLSHSFWDGRLRLSVDSEEDDFEWGKSLKEEQPNGPVLDQEEKPVILKLEQKEAEQLERDDGHFVKKLTLGKTLVSKSNPKQRPDSAPVSSGGNLKHGTYRVEQFRPQTTQSGLAKTQKLSNEEAATKSNVIRSQKSSTPRKRASNVTRTTKSNDKLYNSLAGNISKPDDMNHSFLKKNSDSSFDVENLLHQPSDFVVTSIVDNPKIKRIVIPKWDSKIIGMTLLTAEQILKASNNEQAKYFNEISKLLGQQQRTSSGHSSGHSRSKLHCASYLASILQNTDVANLMANSSVVMDLFQVIKQSSSAELKARLGIQSNSVLHAGFIKWLLCIASILHSILPQPYILIPTLNFKIPNLKATLQTPLPAFHRRT